MTKKTVKQLDIHINENINNLTTIKLNQLNDKRTIIFIIDMVNGFINNGNLASDNIKNIIKPIQDLVSNALKQKIKIIALNDAHNGKSPEFDTYLSHCLKDSAESQLITQLNDFNIKIINKNCTNGFFAADFKPNIEWENIIVVGCCTDICINQFALSCKTWFNEQNKRINIYVPINMTDTFDSPNHPAKIINNWFWYFMLQNGINIIKLIEY